MEFAPGEFAAESEAMRDRPLVPGFVISGKGMERILNCQYNVNMRIYYVNVCSFE